MAGTWFDRVANKGEVDGKQTYDYNEYLRWGGPSLDAGSEGSGGMAAIPEIKITDNDLKLLKELDLSKINQKDFETEAMSELTPYYERLLAEANWDVDLAKKRLEEDYRTGIRTEAENVSSALKKLIQSDIPAEQKAQLEDLNKRGLLGTVLNQAAKPRTTEVQQLIDAGTARADVVPAQPVTGAYTPNVTSQTAATITQPPVTTAQFGGLAGKQISEAGVQQDARQEAITRAFTRYNEQQNTDRQRGALDAEVGRGRTTRQLTQEKAEKVPVLAGDKYQRKLNETQIKRQTILEPYQMRASGITGLTKY